MTETTDWQPIASAPEDGTRVWVKRMSPNNEGRVVAEGWAVFGVCHEHAPQRFSIGLDPLGRLSSADYAREDAERDKHANAVKWLKPDRMYSFPTPTHWSPAKTAEQRP